MDLKKTTTPLICKCGNVLGVKYRNGNRVMVVDTFRIPVIAGQLKTVLAEISTTDYSARRVAIGDVICVKCGRSKPWDAKVQIFKRHRKRMPNL